MFTLIIFTIVVFAFLHLINKRLHPKLRWIFKIHIVFIFLLGIISITFYTADNVLYYNQVDMEGDAQYYYFGAVEYLQTGEVNIYYPLYVKFIGSFLYIGNAVTIRLAQLLLIILVFAISSLLLSNFKVTIKGYIFFSTLFCFNGAFYSLISIMVRDVLILFLITLLLFCLSKIFLNYAEEKKNYPAIAIYSSLLVLLLVTLYQLQFFTVFIFLASIIGATIVWIFTSNVSKTKMAGYFFGLLILVVSSLAIFDIESFLKAADLVLFEKIGIEEQNELTGGRGVERSFILSMLRFILGPGLIRPLFPSEYFLVFTNVFAAFNFWACLMWYVTLLVSLPLVLKQPLSFLKNPTAILTVIFFIGYLIAYATFGGGPGGLRKRAILYFLFLLIVAVSYYCNFTHKNVKEIFKMRLPIPNYISLVIVVLAIFFSQIRGLN